MSANNSISSRTQRLNKAIVCCSDNLNSGATTNNLLNRETLLDAFDVLYNECNKDALKKCDRNIFDFTKKYQNIISETRKYRVSINDFNVKNLIGKGFFGEVHLAIENVTRDIYAIKKMPKTSFAQSKEERNIMAMSRSDWIPALQYAFQDTTHLYLVMEYLPGGDLFSLMIRNNTFPEDVIQFYLAEITLALNALHTLGFVHRDIKPENILLDRLGHLKLADFGSAVSIEKDGHVTSYTPAGTADYIAPELLQPIHSRKPMKTIYNETCDFWSMGIIAYEMLTETTPFHNNNIHDTYAQILAYVESNHVENLQYPSDVEVSDVLRDLIDRLVTKIDKRLAYKKIITHKFFKTIDWMSIRQQVPPIIPTLSGEDDTSNFEEEVKKSRRNNTYDASSHTPPIKNANFSGFELPFVGFGYVNDTIASNTMMPSETNPFEINRLTTQVKNLQKTIDTQMMDISSLQQNLSEYQKKSAQASSIEKILTITKDEMHALKEKLKEKTVEIAYCRTQIKTLKNSLKIEEEQRAKNDANIADVLNSTYQKWERAKKLSEQNYEKQISERKSEVLSIQTKLKVCERELESKSSECAHLQETIDNFKERLKSSKSQNDTEINAFAKKHRDSNVHFEGQLREMRSKLQKQIDAKHIADDEIQILKGIVEENNQKLKLISDQKEKLEIVNASLTSQLNNEIEDNRSIRNENHRMSQQILAFQHNIEELTSPTYKGNRVSDSNEGCASIYCSLESINSEVENQLKKDLVLAKEGENEQRLRANSLEETVKRLEAVIERVSKQGITGIEELLERKNEKLEEKLSSVQEQATVERQASRSAHLQLWKLEKELETIKREKERLEYATKKSQNEADELLRQIKENKITAQNREERIAELQSDLNALKKELQIERSRWDTVEKDRSKDKVHFVNQNTKIHKLEIDLDECKSKMSLFEQQKKVLAVENQSLTQKLRKHSEDLEDTMEKLAECQQNYETLNKNHAMLKNVCSLMETQLTELEELYNVQLEQNKQKNVSIDKLWEDIHERDAKLLKLQEELSDERSQKISVKQKSTELTNDFVEISNKLVECQQSIKEFQQNLMEKAESLLKAEELIEVQKEEIHSLQRINNSLDREIIVVKEENSKLLTELYMLKENCQKLQFEYTSLHESYSDLKIELEQLNSTMFELNNYHTQREIKSEATQTQYKKLIDYLQKRVDELSQKKKKTLAEVLFGSSNNANTSTKKENIPPIQIKKEQDNKRSRENQRINSSKILSKNEASSKTADEIVTKNSQQNYNSSNSTKFSDKDDGSSDTHQFERISYSNGSDMAENCVVCKKCFVSDTVFQCKKCHACVHQYCRGSKLKCAATKSNESSSSNSETSSLASFEQSEYSGEVILKETDTDPALKILCMHPIGDNILLLGCASGLKAFNIQKNRLVHIANIANVTGITIATTFPKSVLISENGKKLLQCDLRHLETRANATVCLNTGMDYIELNLPFVKQDVHSEMWRFVKIFDNMDREQEISEPTAIAATQTQIVILRYDIENKHFKAIRSLDTAIPVQSVYFTPFTAIVSSDKFFEIDLNTLISEEFLDMSDMRMSCTLNSIPMNTFQINPQEYLMCFKEFGIFVNEFGCLTRQMELKWSEQSPKAFAYRAPVLYIFSEHGIQFLRIHNSHTNVLDNDGDRSGKTVSFLTTKYAKFGANCEKYGIYIISEIDVNSKTQQIVRIDGAKALDIDKRFDAIETLD